VLATHFLGEAGRLAHRMAVLHRGRLHAFGRPRDIAAELWHGLDAEIDLGAPVDAATADALRATRGVSAVVPVQSGALVRVAERAVLPHLVRLLVDRGLSVYGATAKAPSLEDVYFAVEERIAAAAGTADEVAP
jgi:ABC-2 type transport system ATP-binding protein